MPAASPLDVRLMAHRQFVDGCWLWDGYVMPNGYAQIRPSGERSLVYVHRAAYELWVGPIPAGFEVHHTCEVGHCYNPAHLELKLVTEHRHHHSPPLVECHRGHPFSGENVYVVPSTGKRHCQTCRKEARERWRAKSERAAA